MPVTPLQDATTADPTLPTVVRQGVVRAFLGVMAVVYAAGAVMAALTFDQLLPAVRPLALFGPLVMCLAAALGLRSASPETRQMAMRVVAIGALLTAGVAALVGGRGLMAPGLAFFSLAVAILCAVDSRRWSATVTLLASLILLGLGLAEGLGRLPMPPGVAPLGARLFVLLATVAIGAKLGLTLAALLQRYASAIASRERRFRSLLAMAANANWETDAELALSRVDVRARDGRLVPWRKGLGQLPWQLTELQDDAAGAAAIETALRTRTLLSGLAVSWLAKDGGRHHLLLDAQARLDERGHFAGYWGVTRNVTEQVQAQNARDATLARYKTLFNAVPTPLGVHRDGILIDANEAAAKLLGYDSVQQMLGVDVLRAHMHPDHLPQADARVQTMTEGDGDTGMPPVDRLLLRRDGGVLHVRLAIVPVTHDSEPAVMVLIVDETARREATLARLRSESLLERIVAASPDVITLTHAGTGRYAMVNDRFCRALGYQREEVIGRTSAELGIWQRPEDRAQQMRRIERDGRYDDLPMDFVTRSGRQVQLLVSATRFDNDGEPYLLINARDVSEINRERLERAAILANASIGIAFTRDRRFVQANTRFEQLFGWPEGGLVGQSGRVVWASDAAYDEVGAAYGPPLARGEAVVNEREARRRDGSRFILRLWAKAIDPQRPRDGGTIWIAEDVTPEREAALALAAARDAAEAANRAKSSFLANTSHEIRTPLNGILGLSRLAMQPGIAPAKLQRYLVQMHESAQTLAAVITDILDLSKIEAGKLELHAAPFDLGALLRSLQQAYDPLSTERGLRFTLDLGGQAPGWVQGDALRLRQVLANLLNNALKFTAQGQVRLVASRMPTPADVAPGSVPGPWWRLAVYDTGIGIDEPTQARLFQPFTQADDSTTRRYGGTGLGLSICRELTDLMGGRITLHSAPGQGSCFAVELPLPAHHRLAGRSASTRPDQPSILHGAHVLVVEDNPVNMMVTVALLEHWGVQVSQATEGQQALQMEQQARADGQPVQVVLMDLQMPGLGGYETTRILRTRQQGQHRLPVIALTAAALDSERVQALAAGMDEFLSKPLDPDLLAIVLAQVLAKPAQAVSDGDGVI